MLRFIAISFNFALFGVCAGHFVGLSADAIMAAQAAIYFLWFLAELSERKDTG